MVDSYPPASFAAAMMRVAGDSNSVAGSMTGSLTSGLEGDRRGAKKARKEVQDDPRRPRDEEVHLDPDTDFKYLRWIGAATYPDPLTEVTQGFVQLAGEAPCLAHWGGQQFLIDEAHEIVQRRMKLTFDEIFRMRAGVSKQFEVVENSNVAKFDHLAYRGPEVTFVFCIPPKIIANDFATLRGDSIRRDQMHKMNLLRQMVEIIQGHSEHTPDRCVVATHHAEKMPSKKGTCWVSRRSFSADYENDEPHDLGAPMVNENANMVHNVECFVNISPCIFTLEGRAREGGNLEQQCTMCAMVYTFSIYGAPGVSVEQLLQTHARGELGPSAPKATSPLISPSAVWTELRRHMLPPNAIHTMSTYDNCMPDQLDWFQCVANDTMARSMVKLLLEREWTGTVGSRMYTVRGDVHVLGLATPQDPRQRALERENHIMWCKRANQWRNKHTSVVGEKAPEKVAVFPYIPRVPVRPPEELEDDCIQFGNITGVITLCATRRYSGTHESRTVYDPDDAIVFPPAVYEAIKRVEHGFEREPDDPHSTYRSSDKGDRGQLILERQGIESDIRQAWPDVLVHERDLFKQRITKSLLKIFQRDATMDIIRNSFREAMDWWSRMTIHADREFTSHVYDKVFFGSTSHDIYGSLMRFYMGRENDDTPCNFVALMREAVEQSNLRDPSRAFMDSSLAHCYHVHCHELKHFNDHIGHMRLQNARIFMEVLIGMMGNMMTSQDTWAAFGYVLYVADMAGLWKVTLRDQRNKFNGKVFYTRKAQSTGIDSMVIDTVKKFYNVMRGMAIPYMSASQQQDFRNYGFRAVKRVTPAQSRELGRVIYRVHPVTKVEYAPNPVPREIKFRPTYMSDVTEFQEINLQAFIDAQRRDKNGHMSDMLNTNQTKEDGRTQERFKWLGGQETVLIATNQQIERRAQSGNITTIRAANPFIATAQKGTIVRGDDYDDSATTADSTAKQLEDIQSNRTRRNALMLYGSMEVVQLHIGSIVYLGLDEINQPISDLINEGKAVMMERLLKAGFEMTDLSGDSFSRKVEFGIARMIPHNVQMNLVRACMQTDVRSFSDAVTHTLQSMRHNALEPADVFNILFKSVMQVLDMPFVTVSLFFIHSLKVPRPDDCSSFFALLHAGAFSKDDTLDSSTRTWRANVRAFLRQIVALNQNKFKETTSRQGGAVMRSSMYVSSPVNSEGGLVNMYDASTNVEDDLHAWRFSGRGDSSYFEKQFITKLHGKMSTFKRFSNIEPLACNMDLLLDDEMCTQKCNWNRFFTSFGGNIDLNDTYTLLTYFFEDDASLKRFYQGFVGSMSGVDATEKKGAMMQKIKSEVWAREDEEARRNDEKQIDIAYGMHIVDLIMMAVVCHNVSFGAEGIYDLTTNLLRIGTTTRFSRHTMYPHGDRVYVRDIVAGGRVRVIKSVRVACESSAFMGRARNSSDISGDCSLKSPIEPFMWEDTVNAFYWIETFRYICQNVTPKIPGTGHLPTQDAASSQSNRGNILQNWNRGCFKRQFSNLIPAAAEFIDLSNLITSLDAAMFVAPPCLLLKTFYPWVQCGDIEEGSERLRGHIRVVRSADTDARDYAEITTLNADGSINAQRFAPVQEELQFMRQSRKLIMPLVARPGALVYNEERGFALMRYDRFGGHDGDGTPMSRFRSCYDQTCGMYRARTHRDRSDDILIDPIRDILTSLIPLRSFLFIKISDVVQGHSTPLQVAWNQLTVSNMLSKNADRFPVTVDYESPGMRVKLQRLEAQMPKMLFRVQLWYPENKDCATRAYNEDAVWVLVTVENRCAGRHVSRKPTLVKLEWLTRGQQAFHENETSNEWTVENLFLWGLAVDMPKLY